jgi:hypothetical protein
MSAACEAEVHCEGSQSLEAAQCGVSLPVMTFPSDGRASREA